MHKSDAAYHSGSTIERWINENNINYYVHVQARNSSCAHSSIKFIAVVSWFHITLCIRVSESVQLHLSINKPNQKCWYTILFNSINFHLCKSDTCAKRAMRYANTTGKSNNNRMHLRRINCILMWIKNEYTKNAWIDLIRCFIYMFRLYCIQFTKSVKFIQINLFISLDASLCTFVVIVIYAYQLCIAIIYLQSPMHTDTQYESHSLEISTNQFTMEMSVANLSKSLFSIKHYLAWLIKTFLRLSHALHFQQINNQILNVIHFYDIHFASKLVDIVLPNGYSNLFINIRVQSTFPFLYAQCMQNIQEKRIHFSHWHIFA